MVLKMKHLLSPRSKNQKVSMFAIVKPFLIAVAIIGVLLYALGVVRFEPAKHGCFHGKKLTWGDKVELANLGSLHIYGFPVSYDCPKDEQFDPEKIYECGYQTYCQKSDYETEER